MKLVVSAVVTEVGQLRSGKHAVWLRTDAGVVRLPVSQDEARQLATRLYESVTVTVEAKG